MAPGLELGSPEEVRSKALGQDVQQLLDFVRLSKVFLPSSPSTPLTEIGIFGMDLWTVHTMGEISGKGVISANHTTKHKGLGWERAFLPV